MKHVRKLSLRRGRAARSSKEGEGATQDADLGGKERLAPQPIPPINGSRPSSSTSSNKPLPGLPSSNSIAADMAATATALPQTDTTITSSPSSSSLKPPPVPLLNVDRNGSENWTAPEDADGAYIRKTYAHFDESGVQGDGVVEGKEWTRERGARAAWEASESSPTKYSSIARRNAAEGAAAGKTLSGSASLTPLPTEGLSAGQDRPVSGSASATTGNESLAIASGSSTGSHSVENVQQADAEAAERPTEDTNLEAERSEMLKNVDRYGFFNKEGQSTHSRLTVMPASSLQSIPKRRRARGVRKEGRVPRSTDLTITNASSTDDAYGSSSDKAMAKQASLQTVLESREEKELGLREREALRVAKWDRMLQVTKTELGRSCYSVASSIFKTKKFRKRVYKGIPDRWRSAAWWAILLEQSDNSSALITYEQDYPRLLDTPSPHDVQIDLDVPRTISGHILFHTRYGQGQRSLFHVLHAFSLLCPKCAYCQGMGPIVATLLVYFSPEKAYSVMVELHRLPLYGMHSTFSPGFPGLVENFYVQKKLCERLCPDVIQSLEANGIVISSYATKWYITLFTNVLPFSTQLRLWDCFLLQGKDLLIVVAVAILWALRTQLLGGGFETAMKLLTRDFLPVDDDALLNWIFVIMERDDARKTMADARKMYTDLVKEGKEPVL